MAESKANNLPVEQLAALRHRCLTDLYFLCKDVLGYKDLVPHVHQPICDTYLKIDPSKTLFEQSDMKTRMVLAPRGTFKTTISLGAIIQLILAFPNIRILVLTGTQDLAWRMVGDVKRHFQSNDVLRAIFPECAIPSGKKWGADDEFTVPSRTQQFREPTLSSSTLDSVKAGIHVDVISVDDAVNEVNSNTPLQCQKTIDAFDSLTYVLEPGGYTNVNGTRYQIWDLYGKLIERHKAQLKRIEEIEASGADDDDDPEVVSFKYTVLSAWKVLNPASTPKDEYGRYILTKKDVQLLFPERLKFRSLYKQYRDNPKGFCCQMLNDPESAQESDRPFTHSLVETHCVPYTQLPYASACKDFIMWDLAGANQSKGIDLDYSVGAVGRLDTKGRLFIIDMVRGRWNATQQAAQIVTLAKNYPSVEYSWVEDSQGSRYLEPTIHNIAAQCRVNVSVRFITIPRFAGAKRYRIDALADFLKSDRLWFAGHLPYLEVLKGELLDINPQHDDCSDAIALMVRELGLKTGYENVENLPTQTLKDYHQRLFEKAIFGDEDGNTPSSATEIFAPIDETVQTFESGPLGYGMPAWKC